MVLPYIGITDFENFEQVERMRAVFNAHAVPGKRRLHVGVMMSYKTLRNIETKWLKVFPPKESITRIFASSETMNCLHYADYTLTDVEQSLVDAIGYGGAGMNALQLDMIWPDPYLVSNALNVWNKKIEVILQIGSNALELMGDNPEEVVERLHEYEGIIHYVLLDKSMGRGLGMDADALLPFARAIRKAFPGLGIAAAGGLGPTSLNLVQPLFREFPDVSIDAQSKLRPSSNALDPIAGTWLRHIS